jgi:hypothetical protein
MNNLTKKINKKMKSVWQMGITGFSEIIKCLKTKNVNGSFVRFFFVFSTGLCDNMENCQKHIFYGH